MLSSLDRLRKTLESVGDDLSSLIREIPIRHVDNYAGSFVIVAPSYAWEERSADQKNRQLNLSRRYKKTFEILSIWLRDAPNDLRRELTDAHNAFRTWLELGSNWSITPDHKSNEREFRKTLEGLLDILRVLAASPQESQLILIPDTNALLHKPDPVAYQNLLDQGTFEFLLLPTVLKELDELKVLHRVPEVREKAEKMVTRIKGWRNQGALLDGVTVHKTITVRAIHNEPDVKRSLSWLDADNQDDRLIASVLEVQASTPTARVVLVTRDINAQNKADAAYIEVADPSAL